MKRIFIALILLCLAVPAWAGPEIFMGIKQAAASSSACTSSTDPADVLCEDFEGSSSCSTGESYCRASSWEATETAGTVVVGSHSAGNTCADKGSHSMTITRTGSGDLWIERGVTGSTLYMSFMWKYVSGTMTSSTRLYILGLYDASWNILGQFGVYYDGTKYYGIARYNSTDYSNYAEISTGTWYDVRITWTQNGTTTLVIDGTTHASYTAPNTAIAYMSFEDDSNVNFSFELDTIKIDDDTMLDPCS